MKESKRDKLISRMGELVTYRGGIAPKVLPLVSIEEYFDGADGEAGLFCNTEIVEDDEKIALLGAIRSRADVDDLRIAIVQCDDDEWPFSDKLVIVTTASDDEVAGWFPDGAKPDEIWSDENPNMPAELISVPGDHRKVWLWFD